VLLVTGASGQLGSLIHSRLVDRGLAPLAGTRSPASTVDFDDDARLDFSGVATLVMVSAGAAEDDVVIARHDRAITAAEKHSVRHVIYTSLTGAGDHLAFAAAHRWTERRLERSPVSWTILRNGLYAELFGQLAAPVAGVISAPFGDGALAAVAREDLAEVAASVAADPASHRNLTYELAGARALTASALAAELGAAYRPVSLSDTRAALEAEGMQPFQPAMLMSIYSATAAGLLDGTRSDLARLLAHPPRNTLTAAAAAASRGSASSEGRGG